MICLGIFSSQYSCIESFKKDSNNSLNSKHNNLLIVSSSLCVVANLFHVTCLTPACRPLTGVVPEPQGQVAEAGALRPDPTSQDSLCGHVRFVGDTAHRRLRAGKWRLPSRSELRGHLVGIRTDGSALAPSPPLLAICVNQRRSIHHLFVTGRRQIRGAALMSASAR